MRGPAAQALLQLDRPERKQRSRRAAGQRRRFQEHVFRSIELASLEIDAGQQLERLLPMVATIQELAQQELAEVELALPEIVLGQPQEVFGSASTSPLFSAGAGSARRAASHRRD